MSSPVITAHCPFKCDLHIRYAFRYTMSLLLLECIATSFVAWISKQVHRGCEEERRLHFAASGKRDEDHPSEIADRTKGHFDFSRARVAPHILPVQPDAALCVVSRWWTAMHYISRWNRKSS